MAEPRLAYLANVRLPSERASALQTAQMAAAFADSGWRVTLFYPRRQLSPAFAAQDVFSYYGLPAAFDCQPLWCLDLFPLVQASRWRLQLERLAFVLLVISFAWSLLWVVRRERDAIIYSRDQFAAVVAALNPDRRQRLFFEAHTAPQSRGSARIYRWLLARIRGLVAITAHLRDELAALAPTTLPTSVAPDGVAQSRLNPVDTAAARHSLALAGQQPIAVYTGSLFDWKGIPTLVAAAAALPAVQVCLVGGSTHDIARWQAALAERGLGNVELVGYRPPAEIETWLAAADVLVLPNSGHTAISARHTSPLKLFEYMAARKPIVASDLPSLREVLTHEYNALLVPPDDPAALAAGVRRLLGDDTLAAQLAAQAHRDAAAYTWQARAQRITAFVNDTTT